MGMSAIALGEETGRGSAAVAETGGTGRDADGDQADRPTPTRRDVSGGTCVESALGAACSGV